MSRKFNRLLIFLAVTLILLPVYSEAIKIVTWNVLNYSKNIDPSRKAALRFVIEELDVDILVVQEMWRQESVNDFLSDVMNFSSPGTYKAAKFRGKTDYSNNGLFYKKSIIKLLGHNQIKFDPRNISEFFLRIKNGPGKSTEFNIYSFHMKAGTDQAAKDSRKKEAKKLRKHLNKLPANSLFLVCGSFNMRTSNEDAFKILTRSQKDNDGRVKDPIDRLGFWYEKKEFADIHSQSTHLKTEKGYIGGGLDDRFDMFLISYGFDKSKKLIYVSGSYVVYGNDGKHLNKTINKPKNKAVSKKIADALYEASDHLPVIIELGESFKEIP